ncbi:hypothetical protein PROFUN_12519 [Planoprotostelium fungivorum]|uniref:Uncharacterized protein n=1 Tax=Planoprotostelium fungivorum TaxID=1890364 RepID=A0A2P6MS30_9EUKA|nr:hypothetical protein PROFUN_12519 [Planoprotostelium fungivorum]
MNANEVAQKVQEPVQKVNDSAGLAHTADRDEGTPSFREADEVIQSTTEQIGFGSVAMDGDAPSVSDGQISGLETPKAPITHAVPPSKPSRIPVLRRGATIRASQGSRAQMEALVAIGNSSLKRPTILKRQA